MQVRPIGEQLNSLKTNVEVNGGPMSNRASVGLRGAGILDATATLITATSIGVLMAMPEALRFMQDQFVLTTMITGVIYFSGVLTHLGTHRKPAIDFDDLVSPQHLFSQPLDFTRRDRQFDWLTE